MNIQDIADFIDLVKNPVKYEKVLSNIKDEQDRLNAVIATVGKASELDKLRKEVEKERDQLQVDFVKATAERDAYVTKEVDLLLAKRKEAELTLEKANALIVEANTKTEAAKELANSFAGRDKAVRQAEQSIEIRQKQLDALIAEYNEKITKLRSVMV